MAVANSSPITANPSPRTSIASNVSLVRSLPLERGPLDCVGSAIADRAIPEGPQLRTLQGRPFMETVIALAHHRADVPSARVRGCTRDRKMRPVHGVRTDRPDSKQRWCDGCEAARGVDSDSHGGVARDRPGHRHGTRAGRGRRDRQLLRQRRGDPIRRRRNHGPGRRWLEVGPPASKGLRLLLVGRKDQQGLY